jgi:hypothetical protein
MSTQVEAKKKKKVPHTYVILFTIEQIAQLRFFFNA